MDVLIYLAQRPGEVVTHEQLLDEFWRGAISSPNAVHKVITELRRALESDAQQIKYIETIPKRGYRLVAPTQSILLKKETPGASPLSEASPPTPTTAQAEEPRWYIRRWPLFASVLVCAAVLVLAGRQWIQPGVVIPERSIAVLPFVDMSEQKDQEYLADGMAEEIINLLAKVPGLLVPARTSAFHFKGNPTTIAEIARELRVAHVIEGSIRRSGNRIRVTAQIVRADSGYHLWSETYDREVRDVLEVQDDIANAVAQALQIHLKGGTLARRSGGTQNLQAYELYLRAFNAFMNSAPNQRTSLDRASEYAHDAISIDPNYGRAQWLLAWISQVEADDGWIDASEGYARARDLAQRALEVSPELADAHALLQYLHVIVDWDWAAAEREGQLALAIDPTEPFALQTAGLLSNALGRWDDAERQFQTALARDPLNWYMYFCLGRTYFGAGRFADAEAMFRKQQEMDPAFRWTRLYLSRALGAQGKADAALAIIEDETDEEVRLMALSGSLWAVGRRAEADTALQQQIERLATIFPYSIALTYAQRGEHDLALHWLEQAYEQRDASLLEMMGEPLLKGLEGDQRFKAFLRKMNLPVRELAAIAEADT